MATTTDILKDEKVLCSAPAISFDIILAETVFSRQCLRCIDCVHQFPVERIEYGRIQSGCHGHRQKIAVQLNSLWQAEGNVTETTGGLDLGKLLLDSPDHFYGYQSEIVLYTDRLNQGVEEYPILFHSCCTESFN